MNDNELVNSVLNNLQIFLKTDLSPSQVDKLREVVTKNIEAIKRSQSDKILAELLERETN